MGAVNEETGKCLRCQERFGGGQKCLYCGVGRNRIVRKAKRSRPIGGKRGRNSGTTGSAKKK